MVDRADIIREARTWIGVTWQHQGRTRLGIDCVGMPDCVALSLGLIDVLHPANYPENPDGTFLKEFRATAATEIRPREAVAGDLAVFTAGTIQCHCGILSIRYGVLSIIHAYKAGRVVLEETLADVPPSIGIMTHAFTFPRLTEI